MNYRIQVAVDTGSNLLWTDLTSLGKTYLFDTRDDAEKVCKMLYPEHPDRVRVVRKYHLTLWKRTVHQTNRFGPSGVVEHTSTQFVLLNRTERDGTDGFDAAKRWAFSLGMKDEQWQSSGPASQNLPTEFVIRNEEEAE